MTTAPNKTKLADLAEKIDAYLKKWEADKVGVNKADSGGHRKFYCANACAMGNRIAIKYVSFQGSSRLSRGEAERFLARLDGGYIGSHHGLDLSAPEEESPRTTWYRAWFGKIEPVEVVSETEQFVTIAGGRRDKKITDWQSYFKTYDAAKAWLLAGALEKLNAAKANVERAEQELAKLEKL